MIETNLIVFIFGRGENAERGLIMTMLHIPVAETRAGIALPTLMICWRVVARIRPPRSQPNRPTLAQHVFDAITYYRATYLRTKPRDRYCVLSDPECCGRSHRSHCRTDCRTSLTGPIHMAKRTTHMAKAPKSINVFILHAHGRPRPSLSLASHTLCLAQPQRKLTTMTQITTATRCSPRSSTH